MADEAGVARGLSVIVITLDEAARLATCLASVAFAEEIVIVDSGSGDGTADVARRFGAQVIESGDWPGFGLQKQRALDAATGTWVLSIDADEWLDAELAAAIRGIVATPPQPGQPAGFALDRVSAFCGQWMHAGSWSPDPVLRLFKRGHGRFSPDRVHERLIVDGLTARLPGLLLHNSIANLHDGLDKMNRYSSGRAIDLHARGRRSGLAPAIGHGLWAFIRAYVLRRGFTDGRLGFVLAVLDAQSSYYRHLKLWLADRVHPHELPHPRDL